MSLFTASIARFLYINLLCLLSHSFLQRVQDSVDGDVPCYPLNISVKLVVPRERLAGPHVTQSRWRKSQAQNEHDIIRKHQFGALLV